MTPTDNMRQLITLLENIDDDDDEEMVGVPSHEQILMAQFRRQLARPNGVNEIFGPRLDLIEAIDGWFQFRLEYNASGHSCGGIALSRLEIACINGWWGLTIRAVDPSAWHSGHDRARFPIQWIVPGVEAVIDRKIGIQDLSFADFEHDDNPFYEFEPDPNSVLGNIDRWLDDPLLRPTFVNLVNKP